MKLNKSEKLIKKLINLILRTQKKHSIGKWADKEENYQEKAHLRQEIGIQKGLLTC